MFLTLRFLCFRVFWLLFSVTSSNWDACFHWLTRTASYRLKFDYFFFACVVYGSFQTVSQLWFRPGVWGFETFFDMSYFWVCSFLYFVCSLYTLSSVGEFVKGALQYTLSRFRNLCHYLVVRLFATSIWNFPLLLRIHCIRKATLKACFPSI